MTVIKIILLGLFLSLGKTYAQDQATPTKRTLYFVVDTGSIRKDGRPYEIVSGEKLVTYKLLCPCLYRGQYPMFFRKEDEHAQRNYREREIRSLPVMTFKSLVELVKKEGNGMNQYSVIILEKVGKKYNAYRTQFSGVSLEE